MACAGSILNGKYKIMHEVGRGGMSVVYAALDLHLNKVRAVKEIKRKINGDACVPASRLDAESAILMRIDHPVLPKILDIIRTGNNIYMVMEYIEGKTMDCILEGETPDQILALEWAVQLCEALWYLHSMSPPVIYRDMKPGNIMVKPDKNVVLIDFGIAKEYLETAAADTTALGTFGYAAPEQFGDNRGVGLYKTDARTDIYSLGVTLYHIVTGVSPVKPPFDIRPIREWNPLLSCGLERIILKCTRRDPRERYQSCEELLSDLRKCKKAELFSKNNAAKCKAAAQIFLWVMLVSGIIFAGFLAIFSAKEGAGYTEEGFLLPGGAGVVILSGAMIVMHKFIHNKKRNHSRYGTYRKSASDQRDNRVDEDCEKPVKEMNREKSNLHPKKDTRILTRQEIECEENYRKAVDSSHSFEFGVFMEVIVVHTDEEI